MRRNIIASMLIVHGIITSIFMFNIRDEMGQGVGWNGQSWLLMDVLDAVAVRTFGVILWFVAMMGFTLAGLAVHFKWKKWRLIDILAALVSLFAYIIFWDGLVPEPYYWVLGPVISVVTIVALVIFRWPPDEWIFGTE